MKDVEQQVKAKKIVPVTLPEGKFCFCCAECVCAGSYNDTRRQFYCGHYNTWVDGDDSCDYGRRITP